MDTTFAVPLLTHPERSGATALHQQAGGCPCSGVCPSEEGTSTLMAHQPPVSSGVLGTSQAPWRREELSTIPLGNSRPRVASLLRHLQRTEQAPQWPWGRLVLPPGPPPDASPASANSDTGAKD